VAATGILSSSHFPERNNENFLICNTIGFLGVLQHQVKYDGADITAVEIEPILVTTDQNFRPTDCEIGGDGALYVSDWSNPLIGHMQHNMRDPNRDHAHGRVFRVTYKGRPLVKPAKMKGQPIEKVCDNFFAKEKSTRYRARLELSGRKPDEISAKVGAYAAALSSAKASKDRNEAQALLECLWVFEEQRLPNLELLKKVFKAEEPRVRAAAIRTLGHWAGKVKDWESTLVAGARDSSALVRAEAVKAAVELKGLAAAEVIFEVATRPTDAELNTVLGYARKNIDVDKVVQDAVSSGSKLSLAAEAYVLRNASVSDLLKLDPTEGVYRAILSRAKVKLSDLDNALNGLAKVLKKKKVEVLMGLIKAAQEGASAGLSGLGKLLASQPAKDLAGVLGELRALAAGAKTSDVRQLCYSALIAAAGAGDEVYRLASASKDGLRDFLAAVPNVGDKKVRAGLYSKVRSLVSKLPANLEAEPGGSDVRKSGIQVDFFAPHSGPVDLKTLAKMKPKASGVVPEISLKVPQRKANDAFALRFTGNIQIPRSGNYTFSINSDDGSRLYIDGKEVINNDGSHAMREKSKKLRLSAGSHPFIVTYYDGGGSDGLVVSWSGPGFKKKRIAASKLTVSGGENLHDLAIRTLGKIPGNEEEKFSALAALLKAGKNRDSSVAVLQTIPSKHWDKAQVRPLVDSLVSYLGKLPAADRKSDSAVAAFFLAVSLTEALPAAEAKAIQARLRNLDAK
jgi:hypothetical protein